MKVLVILAVFFLLLLVCKTGYVSASDGMTARYLFMNQDSTAHIYMKFGEIIADNKTKYKEILDPATGNPPLGVSITDRPEPATNGSTIMDYKITANNVVGMYGIQLGNCGLNPLVIGLDENKLNASLFVKYFMQELPCATYDPARDGVEVNQNGLTLKTVTINYDRSGKPVFSTESHLLNTVSTDKSYYQRGDKIIITGRADGTGMLQLRILNSFLNSVASKYFIPKSDGTFSQTVLAGGPLWSVTGNYTVEINGVPANKIETTIYFDSNPNSKASRSNVMEVQASPLHQLKSGIAVENVQCNEGLVLVIKAEDESPACVTPQTAQTLGQRGWAGQAGTDIVLQQPSSSARPFPICNSNPEEEKIIREKQEILSDALSNTEKQYGGSGKIQSLPWSIIGYDCVDNALEVGILPQYFNTDVLPKYFEMIRGIVGYGIDVALSPQAFTTLN